MFLKKENTMKKEEIVALGITDEIADKVVAMAAEELKGFIPKSRFDEINEAKKNAEALVKERDGQLETLKKEAGASEGLLKKIEELEATNKSNQEAYEDKIKNLTFDAAIREKLTDTKYADLLMSKFDRTKLTIDSNGAVTGIDEQLTGIKSAYKDLFTPVITGRGEPDNHGSLGSGNLKKADLEKAASDMSLSFAERIAARNALFNFKED